MFHLESKASLGILQAWCKISMQAVRWRTPPPSAAVDHLALSTSCFIAYVHVTGMAEIRRARDALAATKRFRGPAAAAWLLPLHSAVSPAEQRRAFQVCPKP